MANHSVIVVGSGPSGYTASIYLSRARLETTLISGKDIGGQLMWTTEVENFPGFPEGIRGPQLMSSMREQAIRFGTKMVNKIVDKITKVDDQWEVKAGDQTLRADAVLIATGAQARLLGLPNEQNFLGKGLSTCAVCDAAFYRDQVVYVVGGGDSAMEDTLALTKFAKEVHLVHRRDSFRASKIMLERVMNHPGVTIHLNSQITNIHADENGRIVALDLQENNENKKVNSGGLFYAIGHVPSTNFVPTEVQKNADGYILTRLVLHRDSLALTDNNWSESGRLLFPTMTSQEGIFAAGDCVDFAYRQAITAAGFGTLAALDIERWLEQKADT